jgi:FixJ family two-component response regulator
MSRVSLRLGQAVKRLMAALKGIAEGKNIKKDFVPVPGYGKTSRILEALDHAAKYLDKPFHVEELDIVDRALKTLKLVRTSDRKNDIAKQILTSLTPRAA